jgi:hypothetical protein
MKNKHIKIFFELNQENDWPPYAVESMWGVHLDKDLYQLDNTPFYIRGVSYKDIVIAIKDTEGILQFQKISKESGHSTIRVYLFNELDEELFIKQVNNLNCSIEKFDSHFFAIDIPPEIKLKCILDFLKNKEKENILEYEEGCLSNHHKM